MKDDVGIEVGLDVEDVEVDEEDEDEEEEDLAALFVAKFCTGAFCCADWHAVFWVSHMLCVIVFFIGPFAACVMKLLAIIHIKLFRDGKNQKAERRGRGSDVHHRTNCTAHHRFSY